MTSGGFPNRSEPLFGMEPPLVRPGPAFHFPFLTLGVLVMTYLFHTPEDIRSMLESIGAESVESLFDQVPAEARLDRELDIPPPMCEMELGDHLERLAGQNQGTGRLTCFLGGGAYDHFIPAAVDALASRGEFYTSYTPYQPEVSQGNLQVMFEYESLLCQLTGMEVANASLYDGGSATVEAVLMALSVAPAGRRQVLVPESLNPEYRLALSTYLQWIDGELVTVACPGGTIDLQAWQSQLEANQTACVVIPQVNFFGSLEPVVELAELAKRHAAMVIGVIDPISLGILRSPSEWQADIVVGEGQPLGNPLQFGGPYLGLMACRETFVRRLPGRIAGQTCDRQGRRCWVLTLQTREQHIRRDKATSNICTNQGLLALRAAIYLSLCGPQGLKETAERIAHKTEYFKQQLRQLPRFELTFDGPSWREVVVRDRANQVPELLADGRKHGLLAGLPLAQWYPQLSDCFSVAVTEKRTRPQIDQLLRFLAAAPVSSALEAGTHA